MQGDYHFLHFQTTISSAFVCKGFKWWSQEETDLVEFNALTKEIRQ